MGLDLISRYSRGKFHVRGYSGNDKMDHCAHIGLYRDVLKVHVMPRWNSPRGYGDARKEPKAASRREKPGAAPAEADSPRVRGTRASCKPPFTTDVAGAITPAHARVAELADAPDLGSGG